MVSLQRSLGAVLLLVGTYFLGNNIIFATNVYSYWWRDISAAGSVVAMLAGVLMLVFLRSRDKYLGGITIGVAIALVFASGGVILKPTSLWQFFVALTSFTVGLKLMGSDRFDF